MVEGLGRNFATIGPRRLYAADLTDAGPASASKNVPCATAGASTAMPQQPARRIRQARRTIARAASRCDSPRSRPSRPARNQEFD